MNQLAVLNRALILGVSLLANSIPVAGANLTNPGEHLIGTRPPEWNLSHWLNSEPLTLKNLQGKVLLVRWWTAPECPYCRASAPALNEFFEKYSDQGLQVIGIYHHKSTAPLRPKDIERYSRLFGFEFPVALDADWGTLNAWWLDRVQAGWTSVSFLLDRRGVIRYIHPGGDYVRGEQEYAELKAKIEELLQE